MFFSGKLGEVAFADGALGAPVLPGEGLQACLRGLCASSVIKNAAFSLIVLDLFGKK